MESVRSDKMLCPLRADIAGKLRGNRVETGGAGVPPAGKRMGMRKGCRH